MISGTGWKAAPSARCGFGFALLFFGLVLHAGGGKEASAMEEPKITVEKVVAFEDPGGAADATVRLGDGSGYLLDRQHQLFSFWSEMLPEKQASGRLVYVESDPATCKVRAILPTALRRIESLASEPEGDRLWVNIFMSPSRHFLKTTGAGYEERRQRLEEAARSHEPLLLTVRPGDVEILDARRPPDGYKVPVI